MSKLRNYSIDENWVIAHIIQENDWKNSYELVYSWIGMSPATLLWLQRCFAKYGDIEELKERGKGNNNQNLKFSANFREKSELPICKIPTL